MEIQDPQTPQPQPTPEQQIEQLTAKIVELEKKHADERQASGIRDAANAAKPTPYVPTVAMQHHQRAQAVAAVGGNAHWSVLSLDQKLAALGQRPASGEEIAMARKLFGPGADSKEAARVNKFNPAQYSRLRLLHREL